MADLEAVLADVSYLMAMEMSKQTPESSKKIILPDPRWENRCRECVRVCVCEFFVYIFANTLRCFNSIDVKCKQKKRCEIQN